MGGGGLSGLRTRKDIFQDRGPPLGSGLATPLNVNVNNFVKKPHKKLQVKLKKNKFGSRDFRYWFFNLIPSKPLYSI